MNCNNDLTYDISAERLSIGTAQFGRKYGINNTTGPVNLENAKAILSYASSRGVQHIDTAINYEHSESILGEVGIGSWKVVTKIPKIPLNQLNVEDWVTKVVIESLRNLNLQSIYGLLLHNPNDLLGPHGEALFRSMLHLRDMELVNKIGISIYDPAEIPPIFSKYKFDLLQTPLNIFDRRILSSGWALRLKNAGVEIHARSIFLQGLLLMRSEVRPAYFDQWKIDFLRFDNWLSSNNLSAISACTKFALSQKEVDRVIIGIEEMSQLREIFDCIDDKSIDSFIEMPEMDLGLVNPAMWKLA